MNSISQSVFCKTDLKILKNKQESFNDIYSKGPQHREAHHQPVDQRARCAARRPSGQPAPPPPAVARQQPSSAPCGFCSCWSKSVQLCSSTSCAVSRHVSINGWSSILSALSLSCVCKSISLAEKKTALQTLTECGLWAVLLLQQVALYLYRTAAIRTCPMSSGFPPYRSSVLKPVPGL